MNDAALVVRVAGCGLRGGKALPRHHTQMIFDHVDGAKLAGPVHKFTGADGLLVK